MSARKAKEFAHETHACTAERAPYQRVAENQGPMLMPIYKGARAGQSGDCFEVFQPGKSRRAGIPRFRFHRFC